MKCRLSNLITIFPKNALDTETLHLLTSPNFSEICTYRALNTYRDLCQWRLIHSLAKVILLELQQLNHQTCKCLVGWRFCLYVLKIENGSITLNYSLRTSNIDKRQTTPKYRNAAGLNFLRVVVCFQKQMILGYYPVLDLY